MKTKISIILQTFVTRNARVMHGIFKTDFQVDLLFGHPN